MRDAVPGPYGYYGSNYGWDPSCEPGYGEYYHCGYYAAPTYGGPLVIAPALVSIAMSLQSLV